MQEFIQAGHDVWVWAKPLLTAALVLGVIGWGAERVMARLDADEEKEVD